jgi:phage portal protein BeeE
LTLLNRLRNQLTVVTPVGNTTDLYTTLPSFFRGFSRAGVDVSRDRAMRHAAVWACVRLRAETIGALPVDVVEYDGPQRNQVDSPTWLQRPNPETTRFELFERTSASIDTDGNAFWWIERDNLGRVREVWVLPPTAVRVYRDRDAATRAERAEAVRGRRREGRRRRHPPHPGFTLPGRLRGLNPIEQHMHAIGLAVAAEEYGESFFGNGATMSGVIEAETRPRARTRRTDARVVRSRPSGPRQRAQARVPVRREVDAADDPERAGAVPRDPPLPARGSARIFRVPPHKAADPRPGDVQQHRASGHRVGAGRLMPYTARIETAVVAAGLLDRASI